MIWTLDYIKQELIGREDDKALKVLTHVGEIERLLEEIEI